MYQIIQFTDLKEYTNFVLPWLYKNEIVNSRNIGMLYTWQNSHNFKLLLVILSGTQVVGSAIQGNAANSHLALSLMHPAATRELAKYLHNDNYLPTTVTGDKATVNEFVFELSQLYSLQAVVIHDLETLLLVKNSFKPNKPKKIFTLLPTTGREYNHIYKLNKQFYAAAFPHLTADSLDSYAHNEANRFSAAGGYLLTIKNNVVGFVAIVRKTENYWGVGLLVIDEAQRGHGYGRLLIESISDYILNQNKQAMLTVEKENTIARQMYYACGYSYNNDDITYRFIKGTENA